jgi:hypothetical protein
MDKNSISITRAISKHLLLPSFCSPGGNQKVANTTRNQVAQSKFLTVVDYYLVSPRKLVPTIVQNFDLFYVTTVLSAVV